MRTNGRLGCYKKLPCRKADDPGSVTMHVTFKYTLGTVTERKLDHYGTTSRHDKKDR
ncbi:MAG TPA: hypothetical protein VLM82_01020 [Acidobacteriota bacterium]|nr:hypothetical protein [Acidobacteriota bacterium]